MLINNPIIPGFAPDPSIVRIGNTFFLVNSSFHLFPGLPIYASSDLQSWKHIGNAFNRPTQLSLAESSALIHDRGAANLVAAGGLWAPTIRHHEGVTYIVCTNVAHPEVHGKVTRPRFDNFILRTTDIWAGEWSNPVPFDFNGIDPDIFFDDDGRVYIMGSSWDTPSGAINGFEVDVTTGAKLSEERVIWTGAIKNTPEGPHVYKRDGWYFLLISEGGTHEYHQMPMARSRSPLVLYESYDGNPVLKPTANLETQIMYTGHGDLFQDNEGEWWLTCLGVRKVKGSQSIMGRETFLTPATWTSGDPENSWPAIQQPIKPVLDLPKYTSAAEPSSLKGQLTAQAGVDWVWVRDPDMTLYKIDDTGNSVSLQACSTGVQVKGVPASITFIGKRQRQLTGRASAVLRRAQLVGKNTLSGLMYYKDEHRHASITFNSLASTVVFEVVNRVKREPIHRREIVCHLNFAGEAVLNDLEFLLVHTDLCMEFSYRSCAPVSQSGEVLEAEWSAAGSFDTGDMSDHDFTGPCIGLFAGHAVDSREDVSTENLWCEFHDVDLL
ncbi:putative xylosidase/arabinosidase [Cadophora sp. MPI-SDFR-AT-0126]|nr:putative xylosidase/arabinosidase [Leotiomycetes sp. MPI-SDFR-AT-0126]